MKQFLVAISFGLITSSYVKELVIKIESILTEPVLIQSLESRTINGGPVFNRIQFFSDENKDIWLMNQSHFGLNTKDENKDRLAIVVDKLKKPYQAYFMQLKPGPLIWSEQLFQQQTAFKVACFICHANGPRLIRPDYLSEVNYSILDKMKIYWWNTQIKKYGLVDLSDENKKDDIQKEIPSKYNSKIENDRLRLKACYKCHNGISRSFLLRQHSITIRFLVERNLMPAGRHQLNKSELSELNKFLSGF